MNDKRIRLLSVEIFNREPMVYVCDKPRPFNINGKIEQRTIKGIVYIKENEVYEIWLADGETIRHWKDIPKNNSVTVEYYI